MSTNPRFACLGTLSGLKGLCETLKMITRREASGLKLKAGRREPIQTAPHETIHEHDDGGHDQR
jgi:hypothetical protein